MHSPTVLLARTHRDFLEALQVRVAVFVQEQNGPPEEEPDAWDRAAWHFLLQEGLREGNRTLGTARLYCPAFGVGKIGRVAVLPEARGRGLGRLLLGEVLRFARSLGLRELVLDAQTAAIPFYEPFGFRAEGEEFLDGGIPHRKMRRLLEPGTGGEAHEGRQP